MATQNSLIYHLIYLEPWAAAKTIFLLVVLYGCETWSLTLREEYRLRGFRKRILRRIFGPKRDEKGRGEGSTMRNFIVCIVHLI